jgi:hypothetical protein
MSPEVCVKLRPLPPARPHGQLREVFPDVFFVQGTMRFPGPVPVHVSRNMVVVRQGSELTLINTLRLDDAGLAALAALGTVKHVVRLAAFHGSDDAFYKERFGATVWAVKGQFYAEGFETVPDEAKIYFRADRELDESTALPLTGARLYRFASVPAGEALLLLEREGGVVVSGDSLQNWTAPDPYMNLLGRWSLWLLGFFAAHNVGPGWLKQTKPAPEELEGILALPFEHVLPSHGEVVLGGAREKYRPSVTAAAAWSQGARG